MSARWVYDHQFQFLKTLLFVMLDLTEEVRFSDVTRTLLVAHHCDVVSLQVSSGAIEEARANLDQMLRQCARPLSEEDEQNEELKAAREKSLHDVVHELVKQVTSPNKLVRDEVSMVDAVIYQCERDV